MTCPDCPDGQKETASTPPPPGVCCPTITCEPIACTIDGVDYVAGETIMNTNVPCTYVKVHSMYVLLVRVCYVPLWVMCVCVRVCVCVCVCVCVGMHACVHVCAHSSSLCVHTPHSILRSAYPCH